MTLCGLQVCEAYIRNTFPVGVSSVGTLLDRQVGDQVTKRVWLENDGELKLGRLRSRELGRDICVGYKSVPKRWNP